MGRSTKKGPFVEERLMSRINGMNDAGNKQTATAFSWEKTDKADDLRKAAKLK